MPWAREEMSGNSLFVLRPYKHEGSWLLHVARLAGEATRELPVREPDHEDDVVLEPLRLVDGGQLYGVGIGIDVAVAGLAVEQEDLRQEILGLLEALREPDERRQL